jgi:hypothetical protein
MYPAKPNLLIGFHGCDETVRRRVVSGVITLQPSTNDYDWLGHGIYFWENNHRRALDFATELKLRKGRKSKIRRPAAIGALLDAGYCLDLLDLAHIELVKQSYELFVETSKLLNLLIPANRDIKGSTDLLLRNLDCAVIQNLHMYRKQHNLQQFDSVRGAFIEGKPIYPNAGFYNKTHIQLCIRNPNCIKGYFIPRTPNDAWPVPEYDS